MPTPTHRLLPLVLSLLLLFPLPAASQKSDTADDILRLAPYAAVVTLKAAGVESRSTWSQLLVSNAIGGATTVGLTYALKHTISEERPDHTDHRSFPSGHAAIAFAGATALHKEYGHHSPLVSIAGYALATCVAADRVCRDRHHWYDVCAGAAIGILSVEFGYWLTPKIFPEKPQSAHLPVTLY